MPRYPVFGCNKNGTHLFPRDPATRKLWERAIKKKNFKASKSSRLCSRHFLDSDYQGISSTTRLPQVHRYLKNEAVPSIFPWTCPASAAAARREERYLNRTSRKELFPKICPSTSNIQEEILDGVVPFVNNEVEIDDSISEVDSSKNFHSQASQTPHIFRLFSNEDLIADPKSVLFYTGMESLDKFKLILATLMPEANDIVYKGSQVLNLSIEDQFLLMLIKIRRNREDFELAKIFHISTTEVGNIFITWVNFVYQLWSKVNIWPSRSLVTYYMPKQFKPNHSKTRVIVDGTEIPITKPKNPKCQQASFSSYKHQNTVKFLVGATPGGLLSFCSEGYAGSTSDRQITERSSLLTICEEHDSIMADRGFNVQDLFEHKNIAVQTPSFLNGKSQLPGIKLKHDRELASNRIHIECLIGLTKTYKILKTNVNAYYVPLLTKIFFVCMMLCNFKEGIVF